eukprot:TRINITY_DN4963_c0_g1_i1.p1 TRINITY_DN4963_c0_g1~~TRINITY_DN4963_c0_g1_i1.p1  ORF type:complete len:226 (+),score=49.17 TRINITY_DN4963_c0_g1_i1:36-713(+)
MASKPKYLEGVTVTGQTYEYLLQNGIREHPILAELRLETSKHPLGHMQTAPDEVQLISLLIKLLNVKNAIEVGVFTGYSALGVALALPEDGHLLALDVSEEFTSVGRRYWEKAGVAKKIDLRIAPAVQTLDKVIAEGKEGTFDFAFIDADKPNYLNYYERLIKLIRPGGLIVVDNVLWSGKVADESANDESTLAIRKINDFIRDDTRVDIVMLPIADGVTLARKK